jgi:hypothetical protein
MICIDIGSGHNPKSGWLTCDTNAYCDFYSIEEIPNNYVDSFNMRNVLHHIRDLDNFINKLKLKCKYSTIINITDCTKEYYAQNVFLDNLWYRGIFKRYDIDIIKEYRDLEKIFIDNGFKLINKHKQKEKLILKFIYYENN